MRNLIVVTVFCLWSAPAFACMYDTDCETHNICISGTCTPAHSTNDEDETPAPANQVTKGTTCYDDGDCKIGSRCIKGSGAKGVCLGG